MKHVLTQRYYSPCGTLLLGDFEGRLCLCDWVGKTDRSSVNHRLQRLLQAVYQYGDSDLLTAAAGQLDEYFSGKRRQFNIPLLLAGSDFQKRVWQTLTTIEYGKTMSYSTLAEHIGLPRYTRATANANKANAISIFVPCHRIISSDGSLTGYAGGLDTKRFLLELEGAAIKKRRGSR